MPAVNPSTSPASAPQPQPATKSPGRPRKPRNAAAQAPASVIAPTGQAVAVATPQNVQNTPRPLPPSLVGVPAYSVSLEIEGEEQRGGFDLQELGLARAHALGFLSALLECCIHYEALERCGMAWGLIGYWEQLSPGFRGLYAVVLRLLDARRVQNLRDAAYKRATKGKAVGVWFNGKRVGEEQEPSDKMADLLLRGLDPETFGKAGEDNQSQAVQVNITL